MFSPPPLNKTQLEFLWNFIHITVFPCMPLGDFKKQLWPLCNSAFLILYALELTWKLRQKLSPDPKEKYSVLLCNSAFLIIVCLRANLEAKKKGTTRPREKYSTILWCSLQCMVASSLAVKFLQI